MPSTFDRTYFRFTGSTFQTYHGAVPPPGFHRGRHSAYYAAAGRTVPLKQATRQKRECSSSMVGRWAL